MAAHDDKISSNRRRLFKALSAAPVVMTLRPGSALATASAYQCLDKDTSVLVQTNDAEACTDGDCYAYLEAPKWIVPDPEPSPDVPVCQSSHPLNGITLILTPGGAFIDPDQVDWSEWVVYDPGSPTVIDIVTSLSDPTPCYTDLSSEADFAYLLVQSEVITDSETGGAVGWDLTSAQVFTEIPPGATVQGITATCLVSVHPSATTPFTFLRG